MRTQRLKSDPVINRRNHGRGFGLPSATKFQSGHLPSGVLPTIPVRGGYGTGSGSDMDTNSDSDSEIYGGRYSVETLKQDGKYTNGSVAGDSNPINRRGENDAGPAHSQSNSFADYHRQKLENSFQSLRGQGSGKPIMQPVSKGDEVAPLSMSSDVTSIPFKCNDGSTPHLGSGISEIYYFNAHLQPNVKIARQDFRGTRLQNQNVSDDDSPSAPPLLNPVLEANQVSEQLKTSRAGIPRTRTSDGSGTADVSKTCNRSTFAASEKRDFDPSVRAAAVSSTSFPARIPTFHASGLGSWYAFISYDACVRLCLHAWAKECMEAPFFLENECAVLRLAFGLKHILLQPEEELLTNRSAELISEGASIKPKKTFGKMKVQVRKVKMVLDPPTGCNLSSLKPPMKKLESFRVRFSNIKSTLSSEWEAYHKVRLPLQLPSTRSLSRQSMAYVLVGTQYLKEVPEFLKIGITALRNSSASYEVVQEAYSCSLRLKSLSEEDTIKMQAGSGETHVFLPDGLGDDLIIKVHDSNGKYCGRAIAQVAEIADDLGDKLRWWSIYHEPEHELVGRVQLYINYSTGLEENNHLKCGSVAETVAYDFVLETAMKVQQFQQRNLLLHGSWRWLVTEFASYFGVSDAYTRLRYLSYVMDVATPTADCLNLVHDLLLPTIMRGRTKATLSHQENRILGEVSDQIDQLVATVFENYKSLDESSPSGIADVFKPATGFAAPALAPALELYKLLHDILSSEAQLKLCRYFQTAAKKRSKRHLAETDDLVSNSNENVLMDPVAFSTSYQKMKSLCINIRNEIFTDREIHNQHVLPSFIDLPNLSSSIYSADLSSRLRTFLVACPPTVPSSPVTELIIATADFQKDLASWNINPVKGGVDAKELFHLYIILWIQEKRLALLELCRLDKVKWFSVQTTHSTTAFLDDIYDRLKETLKEYEIIISRWPEYTIFLESAIADVEKAVVGTLDKQYADVLSLLKENSMPIKLGLKYVQKIAKGTVCAYMASSELGILLNSMKRMLDILRPQIEAQLKAWGSCIPEGGNAVPGELLSEVTVMLRAKLRSYLQAVMEKLVGNTRLQTATKLKKIIQDAKESVVESDLQSRMQPLKELLETMIDQIYDVFDTQVFLIICRGFWDRMGEDVLRFLEDRKENQSWYKASRVAVSVLDDTFASKMQQLLGNALHDKDLEPPRSILKVRSMLCKDAVNNKDDDYCY